MARRVVGVVGVVVRTIAASIILITLRCLWMMGHFPLCCRSLILGTTFGCLYPEREEGAALQLVPNLFHVHFKIERVIDHDGSDGVELLKVCWRSRSSGVF